ncbi:PAS domain S-box protein [Pantanalinema rosaneae CENA516]|uniref:sensor histidine kinase n=1 Tax=Pantanalinema rosaneae TaxID=1620701 RepID=UPI003D6E7D60
MSSNSQESPVGRDENLAALQVSEHSRSEASTIADALRQFPGTEDNRSGWLNDRPFHTLFEAVMDAVVIINHQGYLVAANQAACELFGIARQDLLGRSIADFIASELQLHQVRQEVQLQVEERGELTLVRADHTIREVEYTTTANFMPHAHLLVLRDVTEQRQLTHQVQQCHQGLEQHLQACTVELPQTKADWQTTIDRLQTQICQYEQLVVQLRHQCHQLQHLIDALPVCIAYTDRDRCYRYANQNYQIWFNLKPTDIIGKSLNEVLGSTAYQEIKPYVDRVMAGEQVVYEATVPYAQGGVRHIQGTLVPNVDSEGIVQGYYALILDLTDRRQLELALQANQQKYQTLFEILPIGVCITDTTGKILEVNSASERILGIPIAEQICRTCDDPTWQIIRLDGSPLPIEEYTTIRALREHRLIENEEKGVVRPDGSIRWISISAAPIPLESYGVAIAYSDITQRKQIETILRNKEDQYVRATQAGQVGVWDWNLQTNEIYLDPMLKQMLGYADHEIRNHLDDWSQHVYSEDLPAVFAAATNYLAGRTTEYEIEHRMVHQDGNLRWFLARGVALRSADGQPYRMIGTDTDITERKQAEMALQQALQELTHHVDNSPLATVRWNREFRVERWSKQAEQMFGWAAAEVMGKTMYEWQFLFEDDVPHINQAAAQLLKGVSVVCHNRNYHKDGSVLYCEWYNSALLDEQGHLISLLSLAQDVSDRKRQEAEREVTELALCQREQEFRTLAENSPDAIMRCDRQYRFTYVNPTVGKLAGIPGEQFIGKTTTELGYSQSLITFWNQALEQVFTQGQEQTIEYEIELPIGQRTLYSRLVPEPSATGEITSVLVVARDITDLKRAQDALQQQSEREHSLRLITQHIRQTLDLNDILATTVTEIQRILHADRTLIFRLNSDRSGVVIQEAVRPEYPVTLAMRWEDECFPPDCYAAYCQGNVRIVPDVTLDTWGACLVEFMQQTAVQSKMVAPIVQRQDEGTARVWGLLIVHACAEQRVWHLDEANLLEQVADQLAIAIQQSELHQQIRQSADTLEQQVQERTAELQQALDLDATLKRITDRVRDSLDEDQILKTVVQALGQALDLEYCDASIYNAEQTISTIAYEFSSTPESAQGYTFAHTEAPHPEIYAQLLQGQICQFSELTPYHIRSHQQRLTILACPIVDEQRVLGDLWLFKPLKEAFNNLEVRLVQQVTNQCAIALRQSRLYQVSQAQVQELERLNHLKDDFLSTVSHELRTPMSNIKLATQMLEISLNRLGLLADKSNPISRYFSVLREEGQREINLINDLLDLARLDAGSEPLNLTPIALQNYIPHLAESFIERTKQQQQELVIQIAENLPALTADLPYLERILSELLHNACKYTPAEEHITVSAQLVLETMEIRISNSGVEIPATECDRIFDKFYRIPNNDPWQHGGTGLGLALVKKLTERLGGRIRVESGNRQTTFILEFER